MEHSNPSSEGFYNTPAMDATQRQQRRPSTSSYSAQLIPSPTTTTRVRERPCEGLSPQNRRLRLRNLGFRGLILPGRRSSPILEACASRPGHIHHTETVGSRERASQRRTLYGEDLPSSPVNILQEISNSTRKRKNDSPRPNFIEIFVDPAAAQESGEDNQTSWYQEASNNSSPLPRNTPDIGDKMGLRDTSLNSRSPPPLSSPLTRQIRGRHKRSLNLRSPSFEASKYIEHLELQLTSMQAQLESLTSPTSTKAQSAKLRMLSTESRALQQEVSEWEQKFDEKVKEEVDQRVEGEARLKAKVTALERELEIRDSRVSELEWEIETSLQRIKSSQAVEMTNRNLEKRVDILTELLALSPTKLGIDSFPLSPNGSGARKRTPRPRSLLPRFPSSPGGVRLSLGAMPDMTAWGSVSSGSVSVESMSIDDATPIDPDNPHQESPKRHRLSSGFGSIDSGLGTSCTVQSVPCSPSRSTSAISDTPSSPTAWGMPLTTRSDSKAILPNRQRRMRRFPSGSCSLKPLILPKATGSMSHPASAPVLGAQGCASRDVSGVSLDPTISFISRPEDSSPFDTPTKPARERPASWTQGETIKALQGQQTAQNVPLVLDDCLGESLPNPQPSADATDTDSESNTEELAANLPTGRRLFSELMKAKNQDNGAISIASGSTTTSSPPASISERQWLPVDPDVTPRPYVKRLPVKSPPAKSVALTTVSTVPAYGVFSRIHSLLHRIRQDPLQLARRIIRNAWNSQSSRFGGIAWWLLGLLFSLTRRKKGPADRKIAKEEMAGDPSWHRCQAGAGTAHGLSALDSQSSLKKMATVFGAPPLRCDKCVAPQPRRTLRLWCKFSLALVLAIVVAVKDGPGALFEEIPGDLPNPSDRSSCRSREAPGSTIEDRS